MITERQQRLFEAEDRSGQFRLKSTVAIADSKLELRPAATVASSPTEFYRFNERGESCCRL
jgi:hypothetical protein